MVSKERVNVILMGVGFMLVFTAYNTSQNYAGNLILIV